MRKLFKNCAVALALCFSIAAYAQADQAEMDPDYAAAVKSWTTKPEFMSPLVDHLPKSATVPSPKDVLGYYIGAPKKLTYYADITRYYQALAAKSPRVKVIETGKTEEGKTTLIVFVGSEDSIAKLDTYKRNLARLADPRGLIDAQRQRLADAFALEGDAQGLRIEAPATAYVAQHLHVRQEAHLDALHALSLAGFAAAARGIE